MGESQSQCGIELIEGDSGAIELSEDAFVESGVDIGTWVRIAGQSESIGVPVSENAAGHLRRDAGEMLLGASGDIAALAVDAGDFFEESGVSSGEFGGYAVVRWLSC